jgi:hypothetical protein
MLRIASVIGLVGVVACSETPSRPQTSHPLDDPEMKYASEVGRWAEAVCACVGKPEHREAWDCQFNLAAREFPPRPAGIRYDEYERTFPAPVRTTVDEGRAHGRACVRKLMERKAADQNEKIRRDLMKR